MDHEQEWVQIRCSSCRKKEYPLASQTGMVDGVSLTESWSKSMRMTRGQMNVVKHGTDGEQVGAGLVLVPGTRNE